jgi:2-hydroxy-6-oxonona-2,4-dienedioate hydrolase
MQDQNTTVGGKKIRYRDTGGSGMPVLLSHGIGGSLELWNQQLKAAPPGLRLIAWDAPNHGLSDLSGQTEDFDSYAVWALKLADALGLGRFVAAGNSMGAAVSLRLAGLAPERIAGLMLVNTAALGTGVTPIFRLFTLPLLGEAMNKPSDKGAEMQIKAIVKDTACVSDELRTAIRRNVAKPGGAAAFLASLRATMSPMGQRRVVWQKSLALLSGLTCPALIIHGRNDTVLPVAQSEEAARLTSRARLMVFEDCGHTPQVEKPAAFNQAMAEFASELG